MNRPIAPPKVNFEVETFELQLLTHQSTEGRDEADIEQIQSEHLGYLFSQQAQGNLMAAGAVTDHPSVVGFGLWRTGSLERARRLVFADPGIEAGIYSSEVMRFICPRGAIQFPDAITEPKVSRTGQDPAG
jgi:uncharacterized protein YciI